MSSRQKHGAVRSACASVSAELADAVHYKHLPRIRSAEHVTRVHRGQYAEPARFARRDSTRFTPQWRSQTQPSVAQRPHARLMLPANLTRCLTCKPCGSTQTSAWHTTFDAAQILARHKRRPDDANPQTRVVEVTLVRQCKHKRPQSTRAHLCCRGEVNHTRAGHECARVSSRPRRCHTRDRKTWIDSPTSARCRTTLARHKP